MGCHNVGDATVSDFGPDLKGLGDKLKPDWLYTWLKNPKNEKNAYSSIKKTSIYTNVWKK
jgi:hypothetical protein